MKTQRHYEEFEARNARAWVVIEAERREYLAKRERLREGRLAAEAGATRKVIPAQEARE